jgi:hypothetical protein
MSKNPFIQGALWPDSPAAKGLLYEIDRVNSFAEQLHRTSRLHEQLTGMHELVDMHSVTSLERNALGLTLMSDLLSVTRHLDVAREMRRTVEVLAGKSLVTSLNESIAAMRVMTATPAFIRTTMLVDVLGSFADQLADVPEPIEADDTEPKRDMMAAAQEVLDAWSESLSNDELGLVIGFAALWLATTGMGVGHLLVGLALGLVVVGLRRL